jgi:hypothetical protein
MAADAEFLLTGIAALGRAQQSEEALPCLRFAGEGVFERPRLA